MAYNDAILNTASLYRYRNNVASGKRKFSRNLLLKMVMKALDEISSSDWRDAMKTNDWLK